MKAIILSLLFVGSFIGPMANAASIRCNVSKTETDPDDSWFRVAQDTNQDIETALVEKIVAGKKSWHMATPQTLKFEFSQSGGGESPWSLLVKSLVVQGDNARISYVLLKNGADYRKATVDLQLASQDEVRKKTTIWMVSKKLAIKGKSIFYEGDFDSEDESQEEQIMKHYLRLFEKGEFKKHSFVGLSIGTCWFDN